MIAEMSTLEIIAWCLLGGAGLYVAAWIASRAFFDNKASFHSRLLRQLEEKSDERKQ